MKFYLIHPKEKNTSIFADVNFRKFRLRVSTGIVIPSVAWNADKQKVTNKELAYVRINNQLANIRALVDEFISDAKINRKVLTDEVFSKNILHIINPQNNPAIGSNNSDGLQSNFIEEFEKFITLRKNSGAYSDSTIEKYTNVLSHIKSYQTYNDYELTFESMNKAFYDSFVLYLRQTRNLLNNSVGGVIKALKTFLNYTLDSGITSANEFKKKGSFRVINEDVESIALTKDEIQMIKRVNLSPQLKIVRDVFLFQIETMLRVSDLFRLKSVNFSIPDQELRIWQEKTRKNLVIPISNHMIKTLEQYNFEIPALGRSIYNKKLKELGEAAGITEEVECVKFIGSKRMSTNVPKYKLISSHTARRTGITQLLLAGLPPEVIRKNSGHENIKTLMKYVKIEQVHAVQIVRNIWNSNEN